MKENTVAFIMLYDIFHGFKQLCTDVLPPVLFYIAIIISLATSSLTGVAYTFSPNRTTSPIPF